MKRILMAMALCLVCTLGFVSCEKTQHYKHDIEAFDVELNLPINDTTRWIYYGAIKTVRRDMLSECPDKLLIHDFNVINKYDDRIEGSCYIYNFILDFIFYYKKTGTDVIGHTSGGDLVYKDKYNEKCGVLYVVYYSNHRYAFQLKSEEIGLDLNAAPTVFYHCGGYCWQLVYHLFENEPALYTELKSTEVKFIKH